MQQQHYNKLQNMKRIINLYLERYPGIKPNNLIKNLNEIYNINIFYGITNIDERKKLKKKYDNYIIYTKKKLNKNKNENKLD